MKTPFVGTDGARRALCYLLVCASLTSNASLFIETFNSGFVNDGIIPDGNITGWSDTRTLAIGDDSIASISVKLNLSGGFNGDLYAYISHNGILLPLLNRAGLANSSPGSSFGYSNPGFNITLSSGGANDIHFYGRSNPTFNGFGQLDGTWQPDGRTISPLSSPGSFDTAGRSTFNSYDNQDPNGTWTLFFADMSGGGGTSSLVSWELDITTLSVVPEPVNLALGIVAAGLIGSGVIRGRRKALARRITSNQGD